jgi:N-glycosylase/DNA lyase
MQTSIEYGNGIRILNQDLWETIISFIISANNNIPRIKGIIERLSKNYGDEIVWNGKSYYTFPTANQLKNVTVEEFRKLGLGFRDVRVYETTHKILNKEIDFSILSKEEDTFKVREKLLTLSGVGPKVADCILLFSTLKRFDVFPVDVWVRRVMNDLYIKNEDETKVSKKEIEKLAKEKFGDLSGLAQQYLFYWRREI